MTINLILISCSSSFSVLSLKSCFQRNSLLSAKSNHQIMKLSKNLWLFIALLLVGFTNINAQTKRENLSAEQKERMEANVEEYANSLNLTAIQKPEFEAITKKYAKQMIAVRDSGEGKFKKYKKLKSIRKNKDKEMKQLLHPEQFKTYLEKQEERKTQMKARWNKR